MPIPSPTLRDVWNGMHSTSSTRILVADDEVSTIRVLAAMLSDFGEVLFTTNGADTLAMVRERQPDLVLLDAEMPVMDGFAVCSALKSDPVYADLPILFITAHDATEIETQALELGAVDFITKPLNPAIVRARVKTHLTLKQRTDELHRMASLDSLTGIANRRAFDAALDMEWRRACRSKSPLSLLLLDVDYFKRFNDHYGHQAGDDCLRMVASALKANLRRPGEMAARYGGEEFAVILPACDQAVALKLAEKLRESIVALRLPHAASDVSDVITISIGVASLTLECVVSSKEHPGWAGPCPTVENCRADTVALIADADQGLYEAKKAGRNRVAYGKPM